MPVSGSTTGLTAPLLVIVTLPPRTPSAVGVNAIDSVHDAPGASDGGHWWNAE